MISESPEELRDRLFKRSKESYLAAREYAESYEDKRNVYFPEVKPTAKRIIPDQSLPLSLALLFEEQVILDLFPFDTKKEFIDNYGLAPNHLRRLVDEGALRINVLDSPKRLPGTNQTALDAFQEAEIDYSPLLNAELIESEKLYSVENFGYCNSEWLAQIRENLSEARETAFFGESKRVDRVLLGGLANQVHNLREQESVTSSAPMKDEQAQLQALQDTLEMTYALGYDNLIDPSVVMMNYPGISALTRIENRNFREPFPTIQSSAQGGAYQALVHYRNNRSSSLPEMETFPTDLTQSLIEFGGWEDWANQNKFGGLFFRKLDLSQDSPDKYFDQFIDLREEIQNSSAIGIYEDCYQLFKSKSADEASKKQVKTGEEVNEELQEILQSYETIDRWSGTALKVTGATIAANAISELAVPLANIVQKGGSITEEQLKNLGGSVGEEIPDELKQEIISRAEDTGIIGAVENQVNADTGSITAQLGESAQAMTAEEIVNYLWRNYLWKPAKRGELEILSATKLRKYEHKDEIRSRLIPYIITSEVRKSELR